MVGMKKVKEGNSSFMLSKTVFYNPEMELCRDLSSLALGALEGKFDFLDAMCASGIRGIRYAKENSNIARTTFLDANKNAISLTKKNAKANKIKKARFVNEDINRFLCNTNSEFNLIELDPFGSPVPYLYSTLNSLARKRTSYLSVTATDTAVLCGAHPKACLKYYQAHPVDNEYCHELGARILIGKIARVAAQSNLGTSILFTLSKRHYFKLLLKFDAGAKNAVKSASELGFISICNKCLNREWRKGLPSNLKCSLCKKAYEHAGPLWLGSLWNEKHVEKMRQLNANRAYNNKLKISSLLQIMFEECTLPPTYFDLHKISERLRVSAVSVDAVSKALRSKGFKVSKTHFKPNSIRTDAGLGVVKGAFRRALSKHLQK
ncbi:tRNA (guanine(10)-N(2))-dimethyltransferase [Candidatus Micrarchaeota archaeon]|nr:MAG: tRNA (guanine(10)-N(2))-dimethyltransferase [Candidatus Micrarchaeota archaeon]